MAAELSAPPGARLLPALKHYFGFESFRPLQEQIIRDTLGGRDVFALLPTGGGKSLCFQLPAVLREGLTLVISPLIALMKDQVDALTASGVPATFLNSSVTGDEARSRLRGLHNGQYKLLYAAPERIMLSGFLEQLAQWNVTALAVDEAHCISEWGHDFRPDYRQIATLRERFPELPVIALTATATGRVREDIVRLLQLRDPGVYVASFNRPNLLYRVLPKSSATEQTLQFLREHRDESGIIYCSSRAATEQLAERLTASGCRALPYHAGLEAETRARHQELFLRDEAKVICATIAFGMGINKSNVRFVLHYDLPKNIEGYYQETGRAGRDGLPGECVLLFSPADAIKQARFIDEKPDEAEQEIARAQLQQMVHYAEASGCRRAQLLRYFGETFPEPDCGACDNCLSPRETFDGTLATQKFLSCIYRLQQHSRFSVGLNHIIEVLTGAETEKIRKWGHEKVSTYGIGREHSRTGWAHIGRELIRLGYCALSPGRFSTVELTAEGMALLKARTPVTLTQPPVEGGRAARDSRGRRGDIPCDEALFEKLRGLRKQMADLRGLPAYVVFSDVSLRHMAREYPQSREAFSRIPGVGQNKLEEYGTPFLAAIREYLDTHSRQKFAPLGQTAPPPRTPGAALLESARETLQAFRRHGTLEETARVRGLVPGTVAKHLADCLDHGEDVEWEGLVSPADRVRIEQVFARLGDAVLAPVKAELGDGYTYEQLHLVRAGLRRQQRGRKA